MLNISTYVVLRMLIGFNITPAYYSSVLCKLQIFIYNISIALSNWLMTCCCIDRFCSSSRNADVRRYSNMKNAYRVIIIVISIIIFLYSQIFYCYDANQPGGALCNPINNTCNIINSVFAFILQAIGPPISMFVFGIGTYNHIRIAKQQLVVPIEKATVRTNANSGGYTRNNNQINPNGRNNQNNNVLLMLCVQVIILIFFSLPLFMFRIYSSVSAFFVKSSKQIAIESLLLNLAVWLNLFDKIFSFYIYTLVSVFFRRELAKIFTKNRVNRRIAPRQ
ncbi:unnamed protein product [Adineta ricciae]|uniref:G-protein coupled receptors family 1 profile domain-containing protein n=1 Tax=Adineta ricciae TaxID=249248 RepID=A0A815WHE8_ADIRI|nr:unnamed protein product [Adineta ricciae]CAF1545362.1 unnamed protein product [Adineta ricciae]